MRWRCGPPDGHSARECCCQRRVCAGRLPAPREAYVSGPTCRSRMSAEMRRYLSEGLVAAVRRSACDSRRTIATLARDVGVSASELCSWLRGQQVPVTDRNDQALVALCRLAAYPERLAIDECRGRPGHRTARLPKHLRGGDIPTDEIERIYQAALKDIRAKRLANEWPPGEV
jgi:hypothetical protein